MTFLKTRYYPLDMDRREIVNIPFKRERDCARSIAGKKGFTSKKGRILNDYTCYSTFDILSDFRKGVKK